jgi:sigma-B regulation protein RsbU (phosphoserine phosphatase)
MMQRIRLFFARSFYRKLLLFNLSLVFVTAVTLFLYLTNNFQTLTDFALAQNSAGIEETTLEFLDKYTGEKAASTWLQLQAAQDNLAVLGRAAQKIVDHNAEIQAETAVFDIPLFQTELRQENGALASPADAPVDALIPPAIAADPRAAGLLQTSALLNLVIDAAYDGNPNNAFIYYVGDAQSPVTRAYPNYHLVDVLGPEGLSNLFWRDYFAPNVAGWTRWYTDDALREQFPSPVTVEPPYNDAAGQGLILTMFYPLWDHKTNTFAGAVGADITLDQIVENVLSIQVAQTGFAFLMNGKGDIIAMPEEGYRLLGVNLGETEAGGLSYLTGNIADSEETAVQEMAAQMLAEDKGIHELTLADGSGYLVSYESLPPLTDSQYREDRWRIGVVAPKEEILAVLNETDAAIRAKSARINAASLALAALLLAVAVAVTLRFSTNVTRDLETLAAAAGQVSRKNYDVSLHIKSRDEIGQLGNAFETMIREIQDYTANLEAKVRERTADLRQANEQISLLNERLQDENIRLSAELDVARQVQMMVLPPASETSAIDELDIACYMNPADEVGGDYYDVVHAGDSIIIGIGDVTGHGLPAGIIMLMAQTALLTLSQNGEQDMPRMLAVLNRVIYQNIERIRENKSMTLAAIRYHERQFYLAGQHESVIICRSDGRIEEIDTIDLGFPIGLESDIADFLTGAQFQMAPGDALMLYTDGITEAENEAGEMFALPRLKELLAAYHEQSAGEIVELILADLYAYIGRAPIYDDISLVIIKQR